MIRTIIGSTFLVAGLALGSLPQAAEAGEVRGPQERKGTISHNDKQDTFTFKFKKGELATIIVNNTSNRGDIDLVVEDDNGNVVAKDRRADDDASVAFYPKHTGTFYVKVKYFRGKGTLHYKLTTN